MGCLSATNPGKQHIIIKLAQMKGEGLVVNRVVTRNMVKLHVDIAILVMTQAMLVACYTCKQTAACSGKSCKKVFRAAYSAEGRQMVWDSSKSAQSCHCQLLYFK